jgi:ComF family protein
MSLTTTKERLKTSKSPLITKVYIAFPYEGVIKQLLERVKRGGEYEIAYELAKLFAERVWNKSGVFIPSPDLIIPVPGDPKRTNRRGFNVPDILGKAVFNSVRIDHPDVVFFRSLVRKKYHTPQQSSLQKSDRSDYIKDSFVASKNTEIHPAHIETIWLIDDVVSTQSTVIEVSKVLKERFTVARIYVIALSSN